MAYIAFLACKKMHTKALAQLAITDRQDANQQLDSNSMRTLLTASGSASLADLLCVFLHFIHAFRRAVANQQSSSKLLHHAKCMRDVQPAAEPCI